MRIALVLAVALGIVGCASSLPTAETEPVVSAEQRRLDMRADSLLALPPDSLSSGEIAWLQAYAERQGTGRVDEVERTAKANAVVVAVVVVVGALALYLIQSEPG